MAHSILTNERTGEQIVVNYDAQDLKKKQFRDYVKKLSGCNELDKMRIEHIPVGFVAVIRQAILDRSPSKQS